MSWQLQVPHRHRDESLTDVIGHARHLDADRDVMRELVLKAQLDGVRTAGDVLDRLEAMAPAERRVLFDRARKARALPSIEEVDAREPRRAPLALPTAPAEPTTRLVRRDDGTFYEEALHPARWAIGPSGQPVELNEIEADLARQHAAEESARAQRLAREGDRAADAEQQHVHQDAQREQLRRELPEHLRGTPA